MNLTMNAHNTKYLVPHNGYFGIETKISGSSGLALHNIYKKKQDSSLKDS